MSSIQNFPQFGNAALAQGGAPAGAPPDLSALLAGAGAPPAAPPAAAPAPAAPAAPGLPMFGCAADAAGQNLNTLA